jgi:hypothetical protein
MGSQRKKGSKPKQEEEAPVVAAQAPAEAAAEVAVESDGDDVYERPPELIIGHHGEASSAAPVAELDGSKAQRRAGRKAWVDDDEDALEGPAAVRATAVPTWAETALREHVGTGKRPRSDADDRVLEGVRAVLARADPVLRRSAAQRKLAAPVPESTLLQEKGGVKDLAWHPSGEVLIVGTATTIETVHCAGPFTERIATHRIPKSKIASFAVTPSGDSVVCITQHAHVPIEVSLRTGKIKPLHFMDSRSSTAYKVSVKGSRVDAFPLLIAFKAGDKSRHTFAMPVGSQVHIGTLADATVTQRLVLPGVVEDAVFMGDHQLAFAVANQVLVYDVRNTARFVRRFNDEGALKVNRLAYHGGVLSVGSTSGTVNTYIGEATVPTKSFMNLSASVDLLVAGEGSVGPAMVMGSSQQSNGFRFVNTATMTVAASFPVVGMHHGFVRCLAFNPTKSLFTVGESNRIVNYAC